MRGVGFPPPRYKVNCQIVHKLVWGDEPTRPIDRFAEAVSAVVLAMSRVNPFDEILWFGRVSIFGFDHPYRRRFQVNFIGRLKSIFLNIGIYLDSVVTAISSPFLNSKKT